MGITRTKPLGLAVGDLFCGAGGLSAGFRSAGYDVTFALDKDEDSCRTYERNFGFAPEHAPITAFAPSDLASKMHGVDVIVGGPSCQTFSTQGRRFTWADPEDERTALWRHMLAVVAEVRPRAFLLENVPGLSHKGLAYEKQGHAQGEIIDHFRSLGYDVRAAILLAADYGVPQLRRRLFVVGVLEELTFEFPLVTHLGGWRRDTLDLWEEKRIRRGPPPPPVAGRGDRRPTTSAGRDWVPPTCTPGKRNPATRSSCVRVGKGPCETTRPGSSATSTWLWYATYRQGGTWRDIPPHLLPERFQGGMRRTDSTNLLGRLDPERPAYTITTQFNNVTAGCFTHPFEDRALSIREGARLQSFPDRFEFSGVPASRCRQIGNAVPPLLAQHLACALAETLAPDASPRRPRRLKSILAPRTPTPDEATKTRMTKSAQEGHDSGEPPVRSAVGAWPGVRSATSGRWKALRREADGCLAEEKVAVFVDGCFWHGCPTHSRPTKSNTLWWREKIEHNKLRDAETDEILRAAGWLVVRVWEHEDPEVAALRVEAMVGERRSAGDGAAPADLVSPAHGRSGTARARSHHREPVG